MYVPKDEVAHANELSQLMLDLVGDEFKDYFEVVLEWNDYRFAILAVEDEEGHSSVVVLVAMPEGWTIGDVEAILPSGSLIYFEPRFESEREI